MFTGIRALTHFGTFTYIALHDWLNRVKFTGLVLVPAFVKIKTCQSRQVSNTCDLIGSTTARYLFIREIVLTIILARIN